jgi:hypothetical protein
MIYSLLPDTTTPILTLDEFFSFNPQKSIPRKELKEIYNTSSQELKSLIEVMIAKKPFDEVLWLDDQQIDYLFLNSSPENYNKLLTHFGLRPKKLTTIKNLDLYRQTGSDENSLIRLSDNQQFFVLNTKYFIWNLKEIGDELHLIPTQIKIP